MATMALPSSLYSSPRELRRPAGVSQREEGGEGRSGGFEPWLAGRGDSVGGWLRGDSSSMVMVVVAVVVGLRPLNVAAWPLPFLLALLPAPVYDLQRGRGGRK